MIIMLKMLGGCHPMSWKVTTCPIPWNSRILVSLSMYLYLQACRDSRPTLGCRSRCILDKLLLPKLQWACPPCLVGQVCISVLNPYLCICICVFVFSRHVSDVRHVGSRFSSHFSSDQFLPGIVCVLLFYCMVCVYFLCIFCIWAFLVFEIFFQVSSSPLASVMHNSAIGAMT